MKSSKDTMRRLSATRLGAVLAMALALAACATPGNIADQALEANRAVEDSQNRVLLLNIIRAAQGKPLYFTSLDQLVGPLGAGQVSADLTLPFDPSTGKSLGLNFTPQRPNYNISVQDSREFMRGFLSPVPPGIFGYYLRRQGWSPVTILKLFVQDVLIVDAQGVARRRYANDPHAQASLAEFEHLVDRLGACDLRVRMETRKRAYGPAVSVDELSSIKGSQDGEIYFEPQESDNQSSEKSRHYRPYLLFSRVILDMVSQPASPPCVGIPDDTGGHVGQAGFMYGNKLDKEARDLLYTVPDHSDAGQRGLRNAIITLRSTEAMIQYLGSLSRQALPGSGQPGDISTAGEPGNRIFEIQRLGAEGPGQVPGDSVSLSYLGHTYYVAASSQSMQVLTLVSQVIGLQKEAAQFPGISTFRVLP